MQSTKKRSKAYTWRCKDWSNCTKVRTFAIRFRDDMDAINWKTQIESSKTNNRRVRQGLDIPDVNNEVDDMCSSFQNSATLS